MFGAWSCDIADAMLALRTLCDSASLWCVSVVLLWTTAWVPTPCTDLARLYFTVHTGF
jgi:hypothetical protein